MDISFAKAKLGKTLSDHRLRRRAFGDLAPVLGRRLDDLAALDSLDEACGIPGQFESMVGDRAGQFSMRLSPNWRLILESATDPPPMREDGSLDLSKVTAIRILAVEDYHKR